MCRLKNEIVTSVCVFKDVIYEIVFNYNYLLSLMREVKGCKISDIKNNTNESKQVLVLTVTSTSLEKFVLIKLTSQLTSLKRLSR